MFFLTLNGDKEETCKISDGKTILKNISEYYPGTYVYCHTLKYLVEGKIGFILF